jgi:uncharacterized protein
MRYQPWLAGPGWAGADPKLSEFACQPVRLPHTRRLADTITVQPPGIVVVRGPRQVGKSTFLREFAQKCLAEGVAPLSLALYNAEEFENRHALAGELEAFLKEAPDFSVILLDEAASLEKWWLGIKTLADKGALRKTLLVCTGSSAQDLREGADLLPGRRGRRHPVDFELLPPGFGDLGGRLSLDEYLLTGGLPWSVNEYLRVKAVPAHVCQVYGAWIEGAFFKKHLQPGSLPGLLHYLAARVCSPFSVQKLSRDCGIGANATAESYLELLELNYVLLPCTWADLHSGAPASRKNRKFYPADPFLFHILHGFGRGWEGSWTAARARLADPAAAGQMAEAAVAAELRRRSGKPLTYWAGKKELDFLGDPLIEVKYQAHVSTAEFSWAHKLLTGRERLLVITRNNNARDGRVELVTLERWLKG